MFRIHKSQFVSHNRLHMYLVDIGLGGLDHGDHVPGHLLGLQALGGRGGNPGGGAALAGAAHSMGIARGVHTCGSHHAHTDPGPVELLPQRSGRVTLVNVTSAFLLCDDHLATASTMCLVPLCTARLGVGDTPALLDMKTTFPWCLVTMPGRKALIRVTFYFRVCLFINPSNF